MTLLSIFLIVLCPFTALIPAAIMLYSVQKNKLLMFLNPLNVGLILLFAIAFISAVLNKDRIALLMSFGLLLYLSASIYIQNHYYEEKSIEKLFHSTMLISLISVFIGFIEKAASFFWDITWISQVFWSPTYIPSQYAYRIYSTFGNPNVAGAWFACMFLVAFYFLEKASGKEMFKYGFYCFLFALSMLFTGSRGSILGLGAAILIFALFSDSKRTKAILMISLFAVILAALTLPVMNHSLNSRMPLWQQCMYLANEKPLFGWSLLGIFRQTGEIHAHNIWITIITTMGLLGLAIYAAIKLYLIKGLLLLYSKNCRLVPLLAAIQVFIVTHGLVDFTLLVPQIGMMFIISSSLISGLDRSYSIYPAINWNNLRDIILLKQPFPFF